MNLEFKFRRGRVVLGILFSLFMLSASVYFILRPEIFIRSVLMKIWHIQIIGILGIVFFSLLLIAKVKLAFRKYSLLIAEEFIVDNTRYESMGRIEWQSVSKIVRTRRRSIEIFVDESVFERRKLNVMKKVLLFMGNWNYGKSIIISSALLDCDIEYLFEKLTVTYENFRKSHNQQRP